ncbi:hypothetical protein DFJ73DRAFT_821918 [Zopfochytrium polystomum]|nr:hypothetical protein DFJ73DRAFT_821918 [Zopfochytrium polystomum]
MKMNAVSLLAATAGEDDDDYLSADDGDYRPPDEDENDEITTDEDASGNESSADEESQAAESEEAAEENEAEGSSDTRSALVAALRKSSAVAYDEDMFTAAARELVQGRLRWRKATRDRIAQLRADNAPYQKRRDDLRDKLAAEKREERRLQEELGRVRKLQAGLKQLLSAPPLL